MKRKLFLMGIATLLVMSLTACAVNEGNEKSPKNGDKSEVINEKDYELTEDGIIKPVIAQEVIEQIADTEEDKVFSKEEVKNFFEDPSVYLWGHYDGRGDEISLTPSEYYEEFVYSRDFKKAEKVGYNEVLSSGNMLENQFNVYENPIIVEYYFSGFDLKYEGIELVITVDEEVTMGPKELARNSKYLFALPARYNYAFPTGYEEVEKILEGNPLQANENIDMQLKMTKVM